jgi:hypothetical protein
VKRKIKAIYSLLVGSLYWLDLFKYWVQKNKTQYPVRSFLASSYIASMKAPKSVIFIIQGIFCDVPNLNAGTGNIPASAFCLAVPFENQKYSSQIISSGMVGDSNLTRLFEQGYPIDRVAQVTEHRDLNTLW